MGKAESAYLAIRGRSRGGWVMGTGYGRRRGDADHLAAPQPAQVGSPKIAYSDT